MAPREFPESRPDWSNVEVIHRNTLPPRSNFYVYENEKDALSRDVSKAKAQCLSGTWQFSLSRSPFEGHRDFHSPNFSAAEFSSIQVPGMWQLQGQGKGPHYTNIKYPWPVDPPNVSFDDNECGRYIKHFAVGKSFAGHQLRLRFEGVDAAFTVWLNGKEVGYSQGSRNPSEFDVTELAHIGGKENVLAVEVYQRCDGSYIEDQDQWWLSGIFRDVYLHAFPKAHPKDFQVVTELDDKCKHATMHVDVDIGDACSVQLKLLNADHEYVTGQEATVASGSTHEFSVKVDSPNLWTAETPYLYNLVLTFSGKEGCTLVQRVGFRKTGLIDGVFCVNGQPVKLRGVNRHEHHPDHGRAVPYEFMKRDLLIMKRHNINAIRTSHQINDSRLYDLADELGLWVLDEADLECHGFGEVGDDPSHYTSDNPVWEKQYVDRARQMVARDKNHACVIMWSLGNEAFYGRNHQAMYDHIVAKDKTRLVHYEGDYDAVTADIYSRMYPDVGWVEGFAKEREWTKPLVLCEFLHSMGNSVGNAKEYIDVFYKHPRLMGGFVWEWANHGLRTTTKDGQEFMGYGGDFGDEPNDYNFVMDGLLTSEHDVQSNIIEYAKAIEPVQTISRQHHSVTVVNRYDFLTLDHLVASWAIVSEGGEVCNGHVKVPKGIKPHATGTVTLEGLHEGTLANLRTEAYLQLQFRHKAQTAWAPAGHIVATGELRLSDPLTVAELQLVEPPSPKAQITVSEDKTKSELTVTAASGTAWSFDLASGNLASWKHADFPFAEKLIRPITMDFYRALTDNDRGGHGGEWTDRRLHQTAPHLRHIEWTDDQDGITVKVKQRIAPPVLAWAVDTEWTYHFRGETLSIHVSGEPHGVRLPSTFARIGITMSIQGIDTAKWWGRGPGESYRDKKESQLFGNWESSIDDLFVDYDFPQDGGNRTDVRKVSFFGSGRRAMAVNFGDLNGASFSASRYSTKDVDECTHPYELHERKSDNVHVRLDWAHHGLGTGSCGPWTLEQYQLKTERFEYSLLIDFAAE